MSQASVVARGWGLSCEELQHSIDSGEELVLVDLREDTERRRYGVISGSVHAPYPDTETNVGAGGLLRELTSSTGKRLVFYCAFGERSAMAVEMAQRGGLSRSLHLTGGIDAWKAVGGAIEQY